MPHTVAGPAINQQLFSQLPFALLASLNGVAMFGESLDVTLLSTTTEDCRLMWRDYHNRFFHFLLHVTRFRFSQLCTTFYFT